MMDFKTHPTPHKRFFVLCTLSLAISAGSALANMNRPGDTALEPVKLPESILPPVEAREILDRASFVAFEAASHLQRDENSASEDLSQVLSGEKKAESEKLKKYMASLIYVPKPTNLPQDADILDEPWMATPSSNVDDDGMVVPNLEDKEPSKTGKKSKKSDKMAQEVKVIFKLLQPVQNAMMTSPFGIRWGRPHQGIDLAAPMGAAVLAAEEGRVVYSGWKQGYGNFIAVDHGHGYETHYAHCSSLLAHVGQTVKQGQLIAKVGSTGHSTGPHLHFEVLANGIHRNPARFLNQPLTLVHEP